MPPLSGSILASSGIVIWSFDLIASNIFTDVFTDMLMNKFICLKPLHITGVYDIAYTIQQPYTKD